MKITKQKRYQWLVLGVGLSFLSPLGEWILVNKLTHGGNESLLLTYIYAEISALLAFSLFGFLLGRYADHLNKLAITDGLTGLYNRHFQMNRLLEMFNLQQRYQEHFALIMLDLDHFKQVNDIHGHLVGDQTLQAISTAIISQLRETDIACRFGGEEFLILCPHTHLEESFNLANRIRQSASTLNEIQLGFTGPQTLSAGVYEVEGNQSLPMFEVLNLLDEALYLAKESGRNQVVRGRSTNTGIDTKTGAYQNDPAQSP